MCLLNCAICLIIFILKSFGSNVGANTDDSPVIQTSYGPIQGLKFISKWTNQPIYAFRGIPYAAPPLGTLRFQDPVSPEKWTTIKNCTEDKSYCPQIPRFNPPKSENVTEDCLYLNVYTPRVELDANHPLLPVMVWVHGGGFLEGSGDYSHYGPDFLVAEGVIVVTLNYRLGVFGFLNLGTPEVSGNAGLKDQAFALKWVQNEIANFCGNAANVTLFGESAGSASVHLHYLSPFSKDLFHRVIGESGVALSSWAVSDETVSNGMELLNITNCSSADIQSAQKCLKELDVNTLLKGQFMIKLSSEDVVSGKLISFSPSVDKISARPFLPDLPENLLRKNEGSFVPFIMGINSCEGLIFTGKTDADISNITNNIEYIIPENVRNHSSKAHIKLLAHKINAFYFKGKVPSFSNIKGYIDLYTDIAFAYSTSVSARAYRNRSDSYLYIFSFNGRFKEFIPRFNFSGASHAEELGYIFIQEKKNQTVPDDSNEMKTWRRMVRMWTNFAKFGSPTPEADPLLQNVIWLPVDNRTTRYLNIDVNLTMEKADFLDSRVQLWDSITASSTPDVQACPVAAGVSAFISATDDMQTSC